MTTQPIITSISLPRLSSYKTIFCCTSEEDCIHYYRWNQALSSELYILLSNIEISLRNRIHTVLSEEVSFKFNNLINNNFSWYDHFNFIELDRQGNPKTDRNGNFIYTETGKAFRKITHNKRGINLNLLPQIIISKLEFGKWSYVLLAKKYNNGDLIDWNKLFPLIFPNFVGLDSSKHQTIIDRIKAVKSWRNRLAHLEPVWKFSDIKHPVTGQILISEPRNQLEVTQRLNAEIRRTVELLFWLCTDTHDHYRVTKSYQNLQDLITNEGITNFSF